MRRANRASLAEPLRLALVRGSGALRDYGQLVTLLLLAAAVLSATVFAWRRWGTLVTEDPRYQLTGDCIEITEVPPWIQSDVRAEVVRDGSLTDLSALDPEVTVKVAEAFELHTWVARVRSARKRPGPKILVDVEYRRPVLMVQAIGGGFWPVDEEGFLLPPDEFSSQQTLDYLRLHAPGSNPAGLVGTQYGDPRVAGAARLAVLLDRDWKEMGLFGIEARWESAGRNAVEVPVFELFTAEGDRIQWGRAPDEEARGEPTAQQKLGYLRRICDEHGSLEALDPYQDLDLRTHAAATRPRENPGLQR